MKIGKTLRKPANWEDFETLCKKLWGEIWDYAEITKNGRKGQNQNGVDIYGIPNGETGYYGIQCKGKDDYSKKNNLTIKEIENEINKAKNFTPALKKLYITTTANKDAKIQELVRELNLKNIENNLFEIHIFFWDDIVELLDENEDTLNFYLNSQAIKKNITIRISFDNELEEVILRPKFQQIVTEYKQKTSINNIAFIGNLINKSPLYNLPDISYSKLNLSFSKFNIMIKNVGKKVLEDYKILFEVIGDIQEIDYTNQINPLIGIISNKSNIELNLKKFSGKIIPDISKLVPKDSFISDEIFIKPFPKSYKLTVKWQLVSSNYNEEGELFIDIKPEILKQTKILLVDDISDVREEPGLIEDYIVKE